MAYLKRVPLKQDNIHPKGVLTEGFFSFRRHSKCCMVNLLLSVFNLYMIEVEIYVFD